MTTDQLSALLAQDPAAVLEHDRRLYEQQIVRAADLIAAHAQENVRWGIPMAFGANLTALGDTMPWVSEQLKKVSRLEPQPEVQIRGDLTAQYEGVGKILYACQLAGIGKVAFITESPARGG